MSEDTMGPKRTPEQIALINMMNHMTGVWDNLLVMLKQYPDDITAKVGQDLDDKWYIYISLCSYRVMTLRLCFDYEEDAEKYMNQYMKTLKGNSPTP